MSNINSLALICFSLRKRKIVVAKACEDEFVEKHNWRQNKLKVGMLWTPWHNVQFCKNKQPTLVESSEFEKEKQGFAYEKPKKANSNYS